MLRIHGLAIALLCAVIAGGLSTARLAAAPGAQRAAADAANQPAGTAESRIRRALRTPTEVDFLDTPIRDGLSYLRNYHNIEIVPDAKRLAAEGVSMDTAITLSLNNVSLESALDLMLMPLQLDFYIEDEVLIVTTKAEEKETYQLEIYPARDLIEGGFNRDELLEVLKASVAPESWDNGQTSMRIARGNLLVVRQTPHTQRELRRALDKLQTRLRAP
jgi:hypothetical protein